MFALAFGAALFIFLLVRTAWLSDDAYISFRTVDNFVHGYGLVWNVGERVQTYTHPLWMALLILGQLATEELPLAAIALSVLLSAATFIMMLLAVRRKAPVLLFAASAMLLSRAFVDYSTSGLESPLAHLILASTILLISRFSSGLDAHPHVGVAIVGLGILTRPDALIFYLPVLVFLMGKVVRVRTLRLGLLALVPLPLWGGFSLGYYGSLLPNTAYAKVGTGIAIADRLVQGLRYLVYSMAHDPVTPTVIALGLVVGFLSSKISLRVLSTAILLHLVYVVAIGGDFMAGRFLTLPFAAGIGVLGLSGFGGSRVSWSLPMAVIAIGLISTYPTVASGAEYGVDSPNGEEWWGIVDERAIYYPSTGLLPTGGYYDRLVHPWADAGLALRSGAEKVVVGRAVGFMGYFAGPEIHIVDQFAITDPLLSRLPAERDAGWRIGHFPRTIPEGYLETLRSGENRIRSQALAGYYFHLSPIIHGPMWDASRLLEICKLNIGAYNQLIDRYIEDAAD